MAAKLIQPDNNIQHPKSNLQWEHETSNRILNLSPSCYIYNPIKNQTKHEKQRSDITIIYPVFITVPKKPEKLLEHKLYTFHSTVLSGQYRSNEVC